MTDWPTDFNFETDATCQTVFKPYIELQMKKLAAYDALRPEGHVYEFHLHSERVAQNVKKTCLHMKLPEYVAENMYWAVLPHDIGKMALPVDIWDKEEKPDADLKNLRRSHTTTGVDLVQSSMDNVEHPFKDLMLDIMFNHHEKMDGTGHHGVHGEKLALPVRLTCIVDSYDGWRIRRPHYGKDRDTSVTGVFKRIKNEKGAEFFDMSLVKQFKKMKQKELKAEKKIKKT